MARILVIEDDPFSADIVTRVLKRHDHEVIHCAAGLEGLRVATEGQVDLILLDLGLPDVGGHTVAALINRLPGHVPIVAVTGSTDYATQRRAEQYGCSGYITKPINTRTFAEEVEQFLTNHTKAEDAAGNNAGTGKG